MCFDREEGIILSLDKGYILISATSTGGGAYSKQWSGAI